MLLLTLDISPAEPTTASELAVPLFSSPENAGPEERRVVGVINVEMSVKYALRDADVDWLARFCAPLGKLVPSDRSESRTKPSQRLMRTQPESAARSEIAQSLAYQEVRLLYATNRADDGSPLASSSQATGSQPPGSKEVRFGRHRTDRLSFGICRVTIPRAHRIGKVELPSPLKLQFRSNPEKHFTLAGVDPLQREEFDNQLTLGLGVESASALIYIHGYNVDFREAAFRCAQIHYDVAPDIVPLLCSWPSQGETTGYMRDEAEAEYAALHLGDFIGRMSNQVRPNDFHFLADGLGCRVLLTALVTLSLQKTLNLGQIIFVRPDVDAAVFREQAPQLSRIGRRVTLYVSNRDKALEVASTFHGSPRAGSSPQIIPGIDTIDVSTEDTGFINSGYVQPLLTDIHSVLQGMPPDRRMGLRRTATSDGAYWTSGGVADRPSPEPLQ